MLKQFKIYYLFLIFIGILACNSNSTSRNSNNSINQQTRNDSSEVDSISWHTNQYARLFRIGINQEDTFLMIYFDSVSALAGYFWGTSPQTRYPQFKKIESRHQIASLSVTNTRFLKELKLLKQVVAVDRFQYHDPTIYPLNNSCTQVGDATGNIHKESLIKHNVNLTLCNLVEMGSIADWERIENKNHKVIFIQNFWEPHPLARAEWIRVYGYLFGKVKESELLFQQIVSSYDSIKRSIPTKTTTINVMINLPYSGSWMVPKRQNYLTQIVQDAGGNCLWLRNSANFKGVGSLQISMEQALNDLSKSDVLLNPGSFTTKKQAESVDSRIVKLPNWKTLPFVQCDLHATKSGYNPFWDDGMLHPEKILSDLNQLFDQIQLESDFKKSISGNSHYTASKAGQTSLNNSTKPSIQKSKTYTPSAPFYYYRIIQ